MKYEGKGREAIVTLTVGRGEWEREWNDIDYTAMLEGHVEAW